MNNYYAHRFIQLINIVIHRKTVENLEFNQDKPIKRWITWWIKWKTFMVIWVYITTFLCIIFPKVYP